MYEPFLLLHSWTRWAVLLALIYLLARSALLWRLQKPWTSKDSELLWVFDQIFGYQVLFGFALWLAGSPLVKAAFKEAGLIFDNSLVFFWALRHPLTMLVAFGVFHMGKARAKRSSPEKAARLYFLTLLGVTLLILSAIPWPGLFYGRPLFRWQ